VSNVDSHTHYWENGDQSIQCWIDAGLCLCLRVVSGRGDPVDLGEHELEELIQVLQERLLSLK